MKIHLFLTVVVGQITSVVYWLEVGLVAPDVLGGGDSGGDTTSVGGSALSLAFIRSGRLLSGFMLRVSSDILRRK